MSALWNATFEHGYRRLWTTIFSNYIGPTKILGIRSMPQPSPNNTNSVWLAMNGNDSNAGTQALPKRTLTGALAATTGTKRTIHIFRNGFTGDLVFTFAGAFAFTASRDIQVEEGQVATLDGSAGISNITFAGDNGVNGLYIYNQAQGQTIILNGNNIFVYNCYVRNTYYQILADDDNDIGAVSVTSTVTGCEISNCWLEGANRVVDTTCNQNVCNIYNNIIFGHPVTVAPNSGIFHTYGIYLTDSAGVAMTNLPLLQNAFVNCDVAVRFDAVTNTLDKDLCGLTNSIFFNVKYYFQFFSSGTNLRFGAMTNDFFWGKAIISNYYIEGGATLDSGIILDFSHEVETTPPLFVNLAAALVGDPGGLRLMKYGKAVVNSSNYPNGIVQGVQTDDVYPNMTSPLVESGDSGLDLGPFVEEIDNDGAEFTETTTITWRPQSANKSDNAINPTMLEDIRGDNHIDYDSKRRIFVFTWSGQPTYTSMNDFKKMSWLREDRNAMRFYPKGIGENLYIQPTNNQPLTTTGAFSPNADGVSGIFSLDPIPTIDIPNARRGYWMILVNQILYPGQTFHLKIDSHRDGVYQLLDQIQVPSQIPVDADYDFTIQYIMVNADITQSLEATQDPFVPWEDADALGDYQDETFQDTAPYPPSGWALTLKERATLGK